jgi:hypothetical protein
MLVTAVFFDVFRRIHGSISKKIRNHQDIFRRPCSARKNSTPGQLDFRHWFQVDKFLRWFGLKSEGQVNLKQVKLINRVHLRNILSTASRSKLIVDATGVAVAYCADHIVA